MIRDPYQILGVDRAAGTDEIRHAYRRLAKRVHPDLNPADKDAEANFKQLSAAYDVLCDPAQRARYDRGEIDVEGDELPQDQPAGAGDEGCAVGGDSYGTSHGDFVADADALSAIFGDDEQGAFSTRGQDAFYCLEVDFLDIVNGATRPLALADGTTLEVTIPPGMREGQILRLRGRGQLGTRGGAPGDALIEIEQRSHPVFIRQGDDIHVNLPISLAEAVLGARVDVPTPTGPVTVALPRGLNTDSVLRLRGRGVRRPDGSAGDEYLKLKIVLPDEPDAELEAFLTGWTGSAYGPRMRAEAGLFDAGTTAAG